MPSVGLDVGGSSVKAWRCADDGAVRTAARPLTPATGGLRAELDPAALERACREALAEVAAGPVDGVTVSTLRQGFVLLDAAGAPVGPVVLNSDRTGLPHTGVLDGRYATTGHWPAPELTLPKLLAVRAGQPERWAAARRVLFLHDWLLLLLSGTVVSEVSYACSGGMADVAARDWARPLLDEVGVGHLLADLVEPGTVVGRALPGWGVPAGTPVVAGCGDTQLAVAGAGGLGDGVVTVVAGSSTPVQAASAAAGARRPGAALDLHPRRRAVGARGQRRLPRRVQRLVAGARAGRARPRPPAASSP